MLLTTNLRITHRSPPRDRDRPRARITWHATVLAGTKVGPDAMLGALGLAPRDIPAHTVALGIPAKPKLRSNGGIRVYTAATFC